MTVSDGAGSLKGKTVLSKFMIVISPEADLTTIGSETKVALRSAVPSGFTVVVKEKTSAPSTAEPTPATADMPTPVTETTQSTPQYEVPLLGVGSFKRNANATMRANFSIGFEGTRAIVLIKPQKNGPTNQDAFH